MAKPVIHRLQMMPANRKRQQDFGSLHERVRGKSVPRQVEESYQAPIDVLARMNDVCRYVGYKACWYGTAAEAAKVHQRCEKSRRGRPRARQIPSY